MRGLVREFKVVREWVAAHAEAVELHFLPHCAPRLNLDELVNADLKRQLAAYQRSHRGCRRGPLGPARRPAASGRGHRLLSGPLCDMHMRYRLATNKHDVFSIRRIMIPYCGGHVRVACGAYPSCFPLHDFRCQRVAVGGASRERHAPRGLGFCEGVLELTCQLNDRIGPSCAERISDRDKFLVDRYEDLD